MVFSERLECLDTVVYMFICFMFISIALIVFDFDRRG